MPFIENILKILVKKFKKKQEPSQSLKKIRSGKCLPHVKKNEN